MEAAFCVEALEDALARHGKSEIFNTDQGSSLQHVPNESEFVETTSTLA